MRAHARPGVPCPAHPWKNAGRRGRPPMASRLQHGRRMTKTSTDPSSFGGDHALVIGGSMAGLATARVLADHFERVTLVERDELPDSVEHRKGVPQGRHLHGLL